MSLASANGNSPATSSGNSAHEHGVYTQVVKRRAIGVMLLLLAVIGTALAWRHFRLAVLTPSELKATQPNPEPPPEPVKVTENCSQASSKSCDWPGTSGQPSDLRVELRPSEDEVLLFSPELRHHLHFLVFSNRTGLKIYQDWNSWGYYAPSFQVKDECCNSYEITRREQDWDKNFPSTSTLNKGDFLIIDAYVCDGTWRVSPKLPTERTLTLQARGRFVMKADKKQPVTDLWTGQVESPPLEIYLNRQCVNALNADR